MASSLGDGSKAGSIFKAQVAAKAAPPKAAAPDPLARHVLHGEHPVSDARHDEHKARLDGHDGTLDDHASVITDHADTLDDHDARLAKLEGGDKGDKAPAPARVPGDTASDDGKS